MEREFLDANGHPLRNEFYWHELDQGDLSKAVHITTEMGAWHVETYMGRGQLTPEAAEHYHPIPYGVHTENGRRLMEINLVPMKTRVNFVLKKLEEIAKQAEAETPA